MNDNKIMIVDDSQAFLDEIKETLYLCGYKPIAVADSLKAAKIADRIKPDVIMLDLRMEKMNGFQVADELKKRKTTRSIPIIAMSGYFPMERDSRLLDMSRMFASIKKPFLVADLIAKLERALN